MAQRGGKGRRAHRGLDEHLQGCRRERRIRAAAVRRDRPQVADQAQRDVCGRGRTGRWCLRRTRWGSEPPKASGERARGRGRRRNPGPLKAAGFRFLNWSVGSKGLLLFPFLCLRFILLTTCYAAVSKKALIPGAMLKAVRGTGRRSRTRARGAPLPTELSPQSELGAASTGS